MESSERVLPPYVGSEKEMLLGFLDFQRETAIRKLQGVTPDQARQRLGPSSLTLGGIVVHLAFVERAWFRSAMIDEDLDAAAVPDNQELYWEFPEGATVDDVIASYRVEIARSNEIIAAHDLLMRSPSSHAGIALRCSCAGSCCT